MRGTGPAKSNRKAAAKGAAKSATPAKKVRRRPRGPVSVRDEILRHGGNRGDRWFSVMAEASEAYQEGRERDAVRLLTPLAKAMPGAPSVRELLGLSLYRSGRYAAATTELEAYVEMTGEVDQHPVLMDCARADRKFDRVDELWRELADVSPSGELVTEGRIVLAGALADRGRIDDAIAVLGRRAEGTPKRIKDHHLRLWYALADLEERAGNLPRARTLFDKVRRADASFADVAERLAALG